MPMLGEGVVAVPVREEESTEGLGVPFSSKIQWRPKFYLFVWHAGWRGSVATIS